MALSYNRTYVENQSTGKALEGVVVRVYKNNVLQSVFADESSTPLPTVITGADGSAFYYVNGDGTYEEEYVYNGDILDRVTVTIFNPANYASGANVDTILGATAATGHFGTFTGATIPDNVAAKPALQALETATELRPTSATLAASGGAALLGLIQPGTGAVATTLQTKGRQTIAVSEFATIQDAINRVDNAASSTGIAKVLRGDYTITSGLSVANRKSSFEGENVDTSVIYANIASGVAVTSANFGGNTGNFKLVAGSSGQSVATARATTRNGILFDWSGGHGLVSNLEVQNFNGYGIKIDEMWDSVCMNLITDSCGNASEYAIDVNYTSDTSNHTNFNRIQAENSYVKAIRFQTNNLNLVVDGIHCEGTVSDASTVYAVVLLGGYCTYRNARIANDGNIAAANGYFVRVNLGGGKNSYTDFRCETGTIVDYIWGVAGKSSESVINNSLFDTFRVPATNVGSVVLRDCTIATLEITDQAKTVRLENCNIGSILLSGNATDVTIVGGAVTGTWTQSGNPTVRCKGVDLTNCPIMRLTYLDDCNVASAYSTEFAQVMYAENTRFAGNLTLNNDSAQVSLTGASRVTGNLGYTAGTAYGALGPGVVVTGTVDARWYGTGGSWAKGTVRWRPDVAAAGVPWTMYNGTGWVSGAVVT